MMIIMLVCAVRLAYIGATVFNAIALGTSAILWGITIYNEYPIGARKLWLSLWTRD